MNDSLNKLRKKYIITASVIVFAVIVLMVFILNFLMNMTYRNEERMIESVIKQAAVSNIDRPDTEYFLLNDAEQTENGDYIIPRDVRDISDITVYGNISCKNPDAIWYSAGGGLLFEAKQGDKIINVYKDYTFNKDTTDVTIDFESYDNVKCDYDPLSIKEEQIVSNYFLVSVVWWSASSNIQSNFDPDVSLIIDSIEIHYKDRRTVPVSSHSLVSHSSFSDIFENYIPEILNNSAAFYLVTDSENQLVSINDGSLMESVGVDEARKYVEEIQSSGKNSGRIKKDNAFYRYSVHKTDDLNLIILVNNSITDKSSSNLLRISILVGALIWLILFVLIVIVSKYVIKPVARNMERQKQFISNASHELKTPITVISAATDVISSKKGSDNWTDCIKEQCKKMQLLVSEMLDLSHMLEADNEKNNFESGNLSDTVSSSLLYFESLLFENNKALHQDIQNDLIACYDEKKISQLVGILMDNAIKYSDDNSEIEFSLRSERDRAVIECSNICSDFSTSDTSKLFERFYRSDDDHSLEQEGFGLGLSIAQAITELHNGTISVDCRNKRVTFSVVFPKKQK